MAITQVGAFQTSYPGDHVTIPAGNLGDWIIFGIGWNDVTPGGATVSDPTNGAYTALSQVRGAVNGGAVSAMQLFYKENVAAASVVATSNPTTLADEGVWGGRFRGVALSSSIISLTSQFATGLATTTYSLGQSVSPNPGNVIFISYATEVADCGTLTPDGGYTTLSHTTGHSDAMLVNLSPNPISQTPLFTGANSTQDWVLQALIVRQSEIASGRRLAIQQRM